MRCQCSLNWILPHITMPGSYSCPLSNFGFLCQQSLLDMIVPKSDTPRKHSVIASTRDLAELGLRIVEQRPSKYPDFGHTITTNAVLVQNDPLVDLQPFTSADEDFHLDIGSITSRRSKSGSDLRLSEDITSLTKERRLTEALDALHVMEKQGFQPSCQNYENLLQCCIDSKDLALAKQVHRHLPQHLLESNVLLGNMVVDMYVKCGSLSDALEVFNRLLQPTALSYTAVISAYSAEGQCLKVLKMYQTMQGEGVRPNKSILFSVVRACGTLADLVQGKQVHTDIIQRGYGSDAYLATSLVNMYAKCGSLFDARHVFDTVSDRSVVSWNVMISGYAQQQEPERALELYAQMLKEGQNPDNWTFVAALKACSSLAAREEGTLVSGKIVKQDCLSKGKMVHADVLKGGFQFDSYVGAALIHMYSKCGSMVEAQAVFDTVPKRNLLSWNVMITGYTQQEEAEKALQLYSEMLRDGVVPNSWIFVSALKACSILAEVETTRGSLTKLDCLKKGKAIHLEVLRSGHCSDMFVSNMLLHMYAKCGSIVDARCVFDALSKRDVVSWNTMIAGYADKDEAEEAMQLYSQMQRENVVPDNRTFISVLKACSCLADMEIRGLVYGLRRKFDTLQKLKQVHCEIDKRGYGADIFLATTLVDIYAKFGSMTDAQSVFDSLLHRNNVLWNALIGGYAAQEQGDKALKLYGQMIEEGVRANTWIFVSILKACGSLAAKEKVVMVCGHPMKVSSIQMCQSIHSEICVTGCESDVFVGTALVDVYAKCGSTAGARHVFDTILEPNVVSWTTMIAGYAEQEQGEEALQLYTQMLDEGVLPNGRTFVSVLSAFSSLAGKEKEVFLGEQSLKVQTLQGGKFIHADVYRSKFESDIFVSNILVHMYAKCGSIVDARHVFDMLPHRDVVTWNAMLSGYVEREQPENAMQLYAQMLEERIVPNHWIYVSLLKACSTLADMESDTWINGRTIKLNCLQRGKAIHAEVCDMEYDSDVYIGNTLVYMYAKCGSIADARSVFEALPQRDVVSWNSMISGYSVQGQGDKAMQLYPRMLQEGVLPSETTFLCILKACSNIGALKMCTWIHEDICGDGATWSLNLRNNLIHAYSKCGSMVRARQVFDGLPHRDLVSWNSLMAGYARQGECEMTLQCYNEMLQAGIAPDSVTFLCILTACSHAGMVDKGLNFFLSMGRDQGITATSQHYSSVVDLLGRAGLLEEAEDMLLHNMPMQPDLAMWLSLLNACRKYGKVELGRRAFNHAVSLEPTHRAAYIIMSNIYAQAGMQEEAMTIEELIIPAGAFKKPGQSWLEHGEKVEVFEARTSHHQSHEFFQKLNRLSA